MALGQKVSPSPSQGAAVANRSPDDVTGAETEPEWKTVLKLYASILVEHKYFSGVMTVLTIYALFGDDFRLAVCPPSGDVAFYALSFIAFIMFSVELTASILSPTKPGYLVRVPPTPTRA